MAGTEAGDREDGTANSTLLRAGLAVLIVVTLAFAVRDGTVPAFDGLAQAGLGGDGGKSNARADGGAALLALTLMLVLPASLLLLVAGLAHGNGWYIGSGTSLLLTGASLSAIGGWLARPSIRRNSPHQ